MAAVPPCRAIRVFAFRGDRSRAFAGAFLQALDSEKRGGHGPSLARCLLYAGHTGVSIDEGKTIYGFHPDAGKLAVWQVLKRLKSGDAFPGLVRDDTALFRAARKRNLGLISFDVVFPQPVFRVFEKRLGGERKASNYRYGRSKRRWRLQLHHVAGATRPAVADWADGRVRRPAWDCDLSQPTVWAMCIASERP